MSDEVLRDLVVRMATDPTFAEQVRTDPAGASAAYGLSQEQIDRLRELAPEEAGAGPTMLDARLSKSSLFFGGGLDLHGLVGGVPDADASPQLVGHEVGLSAMLCNEISGADVVDGQHEGGLDPTYFSCDEGAQPDPAAMLCNEGAQSDSAAISCNVKPGDILSIQCNDLDSLDDPFALFCDGKPADPATLLCNGAPADPLSIQCNDLDGKVDPAALLCNGLTDAVSLQCNDFGPTDELGKQSK